MATYTAQHSHVKNGPCVVVYFGAFILPCNEDDLDGVAIVVVVIERVFASVADFLSIGRLRTL